jgi:peptidoglycan-N-acetylglucosamine deacetylase
MNPWLIGVPAAAGAAAAAACYGGVHPRSQLFGSTICRASPGQLAITFDDGPNPAITPKLLDLLEKHQAKASFFVIGRFVRACPGLTREIAARSHLVGNHTENHPNLFWLGRAAVHEELRRCQAALEDTLAAPAGYFRPPFGFRNPWVVPTARELGMQTVLWTLIPGDWRAKSAPWLTKRMKPIADRAVNAAGGSGDVLCLHDGAHRALGADRSITLQALEYWLPRWRDLGLKFVTISEAVKTPAR